MWSSYFCKEQQVSKNTKKNIKSTQKGHIYRNGETFIQMLKRNLRKEASLSKTGYGRSKKYFSFLDFVIETSQTMTYLKL